MPDPSVRPFHGSETLHDARYASRFYIETTFGGPGRPWVPPDFGKRRW